DRRRIFETEQRGGRAITVLLVTHHDSHAVELRGVEGIFVGDVVADVGRQHSTRVVGTVASLDVLEEPIQRRALAPVYVWTQLDDFATGGDPQALGAPDVTGRHNHPVDVFGICIAVVNSDCKAFVLHQYSRDITQRLC